MVNTKSIDYLIVDTTAFIQNAPLQDIAENIITCQEVINEITNKKQLRRLIVLPYNLIVKEVFPENVKIISDFSKRTGDYPSLSATDIKVMALTYQLEKEKIGINHLRTEPVVQRPLVSTSISLSNMIPDVTGFVTPENREISSQKTNQLSKEDIKQVILENDMVPLNRNNIDRVDLEESCDKLTTLSIDSSVEPDLSDMSEYTETIISEQSCNEVATENATEEVDDDVEGWITPSNVETAKKQIISGLTDDDQVAVACITTDFAMQNVLKQMNLKVAALDGRIIQQLRTFILRCYTCFKTTSIMTKTFCPNCGNNTLKKVAVSMDENGKLQIHINLKRPLTARGKKFSLPKIKGGKHPNNPILVEDQPIPDNKPSRLARTKNNPLDDDYIAGFSPFVMRDINSKSAQLCIRPGRDVKNWVRKNPNEARRKRK